MSLNLNELTDENLKELLKEATEKVANGDLNLLQIVEDLGPYLTNTNVGLRKLGLSLLTGIVCAIKPDFLNQDECKILCQFYRDRMRDHHSLIPDVISGLSSILCMPNLGSNEVVFVLTGVFEEIHAQSQVLAERTKIFSFHWYLLNHRLQDLQLMKMNYLLGYIQTVEEEKDPNNLVKIFSSWPIIVQNFDLEALTEDVFECLSCYFPIDFAPPPGIHGNVTKDQLIALLRICITDPVFVPLSIPLFLEKLESDYVEAKVDSAESLNATLLRCELDNCGHFVDQIWNAVKREVLGIRMQTSERLVKICLEIIKTMTSLLARSIQTPENRAIQTKWLESIWNDCGRHLVDIEMKFMTSSLDIFSHIIASKCDFPCIFILDRAIPVLITLFHGKKDSPHSLVTILKAIAQLLKDAPTPVNNPDWYENYLLVCNLSINDSKDSTLESAACLALESGVNIIKPEHAEMIIESRLETISIGKIPSSGVVNLIASLSRKCSKPNELDISMLFDNLNLHKDATLPVLSNLCKNSQFLERVYPRVEDELSRCKGDSSTLSWCTQLLKDIWDNHKDLSHFLNDNKVLDKLVDKIICWSECPAEIRTVCINLLKDLASNLSLIYSDWINTMLTTLMEGSVNRTTQFLVMENLFCNLSSEVLANVPSDFVKRVMFCEIDDLEASLSVYRMRGAIVNKLNSVDDLIELSLNSFSEESQSVSNAFYLGWILRGLLLNNHRLLVKTSKVVLDYLRSEVDGVANQMSKSFAEALRKTSDFLQETEPLGSLARQKLFMITKAGLLSGYNGGSNRSAHLRCLICQLENLPRFILASEMLSLVPVIIETINSYDNDDELVIGTLVAIKDLMNQDPKMFATLLFTLMPHWISLSIDRNRQMDVRIEALNVIRAASKSESSEVVRLKKDVMLQLVGALDDHKRLVRQSAAAARNAWAVAV